MTDIYDEEERLVRAEVGECTAAPDHVEVYGGCIYCGAYLYLGDWEDQA